MEIRNVINESSTLVLHTAIAAAVGYLAARIFTHINPAHGAVFCAAAFLVSKLTAPLFDRIFGGPRSNEASRILGEILNIGVITVSGAALATAAGFPITITGGLILTGCIMAAFAVTLVAIAAIQALSDRLKRA